MRGIICSITEIKILRQTLLIKSEIKLGRQLETNCATCVPIGVSILWKKMFVMIAREEKQRYN